MMSAEVSGIFEQVYILVAQSLDAGYYALGAREIDYCAFYALQRKFIAP